MKTENVPALAILEGGLLERATIGRFVGDTEYADRAGRTLTDSGRTTTVMGWGKLDGTVRILVDEYGSDLYYVR